MNAVMAQLGSARTKYPELVDVADHSIIHGFYNPPVIEPVVFMHCNPPLNICVRIVSPLDCETRWHEERHGGGWMWVGLSEN